MWLRAVCDPGRYAIIQPMKEYIRKADIILFIVLVAAGLAASAFLSLTHADPGSGAKVVIESGGELFAEYPLSEDTEIIVPAPSGVKYADPKAPPAGADDECTQYRYFNIVRISGGEVSVSAASCRNQVCAGHGGISKTGESIVCLPNRLVVTIEGGSGYDTVTS